MHTKQSSKGDGRRKSSKVDEDDSSKNLGIESVCDVALVVLETSLYVSNHPPKGPTCSGQGVFRCRLSRDGNWGKQFKYKMNML